MCSAYLRAFRNCPDNPSMPLDVWRRLLWSQALGEPQQHVAGKIYEIWLEMRYTYLVLSAEVKALLVNLRQKHLLGLITNGPSRAQWEKIERLQLDGLFDVMLVSGDFPWEKPHPNIFLEGCRYLGVEPRNCMMVGDKLETDILGGIEAKFAATVWVPLSTAETKADFINPDYTVTDVVQVANLLPTNGKACVRVRMMAERRHRGVCSSAPDLEDCNSNGSDGS